VRVVEGISAQRALEKREHSHASAEGGLAGWSSGLVAARRVQGKKKESLVDSAEGSLQTASARGEGGKLSFITQGGAVGVVVGLGSTWRKKRIGFSEKGGSPSQITLGGKKSVRRSSKLRGN